MGAKPSGATRRDISRLRGLARHASDRRAAGEILLEGAKVIGAAMTSDLELLGLYVGSGADQQVIDQATSGGCPVFEVDDLSLARITTTATPQPEVAVARRPTHHLADIEGHPLVVGVDLQDPGNAGTLVRSALSAGAAGVVFCGDSVDPFSPKTVRSSAGAVFGLPVLEAGDPLEVLSDLHDRGLQLMATDSSGSADLFEVDLSAPSAFVLGNEAHGLTNAVLDGCDTVLRIPMAAGESLNVGVAASVVLFEAFRQRRKEA